MRVLVNYEKCCGAGQCVIIAPKVFDQREDGIVVLLDHTPPPEHYKAVREAVGVCPGAALRLEQDT